MTQGPPPSARLLDTLTSECCQELFAAYGFPLRRVGGGALPPPDRLLYCSVMGFGGRQLRGALVLVSTAEPLCSTHEGDTESQQDWIRELSNQLMGRVKNRLLTLGADILLTTPAAVSGESLSLMSSQASSLQIFEGEAGMVWTWIEFECRDGFVFPSSPPPSDEPMLHEGDFLLF